MSEYGDAPPQLEARLRPICRALPQVQEQQAWAGTRWRIRQRSFAHILTVGPTHHASSFGPPTSGERTCVLIFRSPEDEIAGLIGTGAPFFQPPWGHDVIGMSLEGAPDWDEIVELITESYCVQAPAKLAAQVDRPTS